MCFQREGGREGQRVGWVQRAQMDGGDIRLTGFVDLRNIISLQHIQSLQRESETLSDNELTMNSCNFRAQL